jgi:hypothetical protein
MHTQKILIGVLFFFLAFAVMPVSAAQEWVTMAGTSTPEKPSAAVLGSDDQETMISFSTNGFWTEETTEGGATYQVLQFPGYYTTLEIGKPQLPVITELVAVPGDAIVEVSIVDYTERVLTGYKVYPFQTPLLEDEEPSGFDIDEVFYTQDEFYPAETITLGDPKIWRDLRVVALQVNPFKFNPATGVLVVYEDITIKLTYTGGSDMNVLMPTGRPVSPAYDGLYEAGVLNYGELEMEVEGEGGIPADPGDYDYLIIAVDGYVDNMTPFIAWKEALGLETEIVALSVVGSTISEIKAYIDQEYNDHGIDYVLFVGNESQIPGYMGWNCFSDYYYSLIVGSDNYPDIAIGRLCVFSEADVNNMVDKSILYEKDPPTGDWLEKALLVANRENAPYKYQQCKERIRLALETPSLTYTILYPDFTTAYGADTTVGGDRATNADVIGYIDDGQRVVNYRGHGSNTSWTSWNIFYEYFGTTEINMLDNGDRTPVVFSIACYNARLDASSPCMAENFTLHDEAAVAFLGASQPSYTTANHTYDKKLFSAVFDEGVNATGDASNLAAIKIINEHYGAGLANARMYLWLGDPSLQVVFTTAPPPQVIATSPAMNEIDVLPSTAIEVYWDIKMDFFTINNTSLIVNGSSTGLHDEGAWYCGLDQKSVGFNPDDDFAEGEVVTVVLTTDIKSAHGVNMVNSYSWSFTVASTRASPGTFYHDDDYDVGTFPFGAYAAVLDTDDDMDLAVANRNSNNIGILLNNGDATFAAPSNFATDTTPVYVYSADFDADGDMDMAAADFVIGEVSVLLNNGNGTFATYVNYDTDTASTGVVAADFDGDGVIDLAVANWSFDNVSILLGDGDGTFGTAVNYGTGNGPNHVFAADLDNDADVDLITTNGLSNSVSIMLNNGDATFGSHTDFTTGTCPEGSYAADLDGDGDLDLVTANKGSNNVSVLINGGSGSYGTHVTYDVGSYPMHLYASDFDGDGDIDLATANIISDDVSILRSNGDGTFATHVDYDAGDGPNHVYSSDLDGDGDLDLAVVNQYSYDVSILLNRPILTPGPPILSSPWNGQVIIILGSSTKVTLNWYDVVYADNYEVLLDNNSDFSSPIANPNNLTNSYYKTPYLSSGKYYWKVRAYNEAGWGDWSTTWNFRILRSYPPDPSCPVLFSHDDQGFKQENPLLTACEKSGYVDVVTDYYHLSSPIAVRDGRARFQLREMEDEITYLHDIELITVDHSDQARVACAVDGRISLYEETMPPLSAVDHNGLDRLAEVRDLDGTVFMSQEPGYLIVTFPNLGQMGANFKFEIPQKPGPCEFKVDPNEGREKNQLVVEILDPLGNWVELPATPSRDNTDEGVLFTDIVGQIEDEVITLKFSWNVGYTTDAVGQVIPVDEIPQTSHWPIDRFDLRLAGAEQVGWNGFVPGDPLVLVKGDVFEFSFDVGEAVEQGQVRDYIIKAMGRYQPDYALYPHLLPQQFELYANYPNPFNPMTTIGYDLAGASQVKLDIYNVLGQHIATLVDTRQEAGRYQVVWDGNDSNGRAVASGMYFYRLTTDEYVASKKMVLLK